MMLRGRVLALRDDHHQLPILGGQVEQGVADLTGAAQRQTRRQNPPPVLLRRTLDETHHLTSVGAYGRMVGQFTLPQDIDIALSMLNMRPGVVTRRTRREIVQLNLQTHAQARLYRRVDAPVPVATALQSIAASGGPPYAPHPLLFDDGA